KADTEFFNRIALVLQFVAVVVVETGVAEASLVHQGRRQNPRVGNHGLLYVYGQKMPIELQSRLNLRLILPAITAEPVGFRILSEIDPLRELIFIVDVIV